MCAEVSSSSWVCACVVLCSVAQQDKGKTVTFASDDLVLHYGGGGLSRHYHRRNKSTPTIHHQQQYQHHQLGLLQQQRMTHPPPRHHYRKRKWCCSIATHSRLTQNYDDRYPLFRDCYISTSAAIFIFFLLFSFLTRFRTDWMTDCTTLSILFFKFLIHDTNEWSHHHLLF